MTNEELEKSYSEVLYGYDEPDVMYMDAAALRFHIEANGGNPDDARDIDGNAIRDGVVYALCVKGIIPVLA